MLESYNEFIKFINKLDYKPTLLLHSCCAPCSSHTILLLKKFFDLTIYYSNDNIYPKEEFNIRLNEQINFAKKHDIKVISDYCIDDFNNAISGFEHMGEKSIRCYKCYELRLTKTSKKAAELGFDFFTTTLSISPYKLAKWINKIGYELEEKYNVKYLYSDFKKENGYQHSITLSKEYGLYRQDYCGCIYSMKEKEEKDAKAKEN